MNKKRVLVLLAVLLVASLCLVPAVAADTDEGLASLKARGDGVAALHGDGWLRVSGNGILWIKGAEYVADNNFDYGYWDCCGCFAYLGI